RLPDAGLAGDQHDRGPASLRRGQGTAEDGTLGVASHQHPDHAPSLNTVYLRAEDDDGVFGPAAGLGPGAVAGGLATVAAHFPVDDPGRGAVASWREQLADDLLVGPGLRGVKRLGGETRGGRLWCAGPPAGCG